MTRKAAFWILFVVVSAASLTFAIANFSRSFSLISLDLHMNRGAAMAAAKDLAARHRLGPGGRAQQAAAFGVDDTVKTFMELEGGGAQAFQRMVRDHLYDAYTWQVRLFREGETREATLRFRPDGTPYGFVDHLRESDPGASLPAESARSIGEAAATRDWGLDLARYTLIETSTERRPGGRADHTFVYERHDAAAGAGRYRVRLVVGGDRLTELTHLLRVPEAFSRKYEKMRSSNTAIAVAAQVLMFLLYVVGGCVVGMVLLMRQRWLWWRPAVLWGFLIAGLYALTTFNALPLAWMDYDTAEPGGTFLIQKVLIGLLVLLADGCLVALTFAAAEGLGRKAFPDHPQLWRSWSRDAAASRAVVGRTMGGILFTGIEFGYIIAFYLIATRLWKWWTPAEVLVDPNILATYVPWLSAVAPSLHAGFWEESLFRAVPLAGAALIGDRLGNRKLWIGIALVLEALIFGGAHANYASWPAYSRPIELFVPSLVWGLIYLRFGLIPSIITHYLFDLSLFSLPLFTSTAASSRIDQTFVIACGAVPLGVIGWALLRRRQMVELPDSLRNRAWTPPAPEPEPEPQVIAAPVAGWSSTRTRVVVALGVVGLVAWAMLGQWTADAPPIRQRRGEALDTGLKALGERGYQPSPKWKRIVTTDADDLQSVFAWRALGPEVYHALIGKDLVPPHWELRLASFRGDVVERAEEWRAWITGNGATWRARHVLPDGRKGLALDEAASRALAHAELRQRFHLEPTRVKEVSATSAKHPARLDWNFTFADTAPPRLTQGERRIAIEVAGDSVTDAYRFVFVPEEWQRKYRGENASVRVLDIVRALVIAVVFIVAAALGIVAWTRRAFPVGFALRFFALWIGLGVVGTVNSWPQVEASFSTAQPYDLQFSIAIVGLMLVQLVLAAVLALVAGFCLGELPAADRGRSPLVVALAVGALASGFVVALGRLSVASGPVLGDFMSAQATFPWLDRAIRAGTGLLMRATALFALVTLVRRVTEGGTRRQPWGLALLFVVGGMTVMSAGGATTAGSWLALAGVTGVGLVALERLVLSYDARVIPGLVAAMSALVAVRSIVRQSYPDAVVGGVLELVAIAVVLTWWMRELRPVGETGRASGVTPSPVTPGAPAKA
jgi:hypothetical protein